MRMGKLVLVTVTLLIASTNAVSWGYHGDHGPTTWGVSYKHCNGSGQSPIDINTRDTEIDYNLPIADRMLFYKPPTKMNISNNGHSLVLTFEEGGYEIIDSNILPFNAKIAQMHFHWGKGSRKPGSEHEINGKRYFGELHAVHYNTKYANITEAADKPDGLAVFGWFIDTSYPQVNQAMRNVFHLGNILAKNKGPGRAIKPLSLESIIPADLNVYYRYNGSLTTPPCYETVTWTMFEKPIQIAKRQAKFLADRLFENEIGIVEGTRLIKDNFRPIQPLNGRRVTRPAPVIQKSAP